MFNLFKTKANIDHEKYITDMEYKTEELKYLHSQLKGTDATELQKIVEEAIHLNTLLSESVCDLVERVEALEKINK